MGKIIAVVVSGLGILGGIIYGLHQLFAWIGGLFSAAISDPSIADLAGALVFVGGHVFLTLPVVFFLISLIIMAIGFLID